MKRLILILLSTSAILASSCISSQAQGNDTERYFQRYGLLVSKLGYDGVGIETLLDRWEAADSSDTRVYEAKFRYYFTKSRRDSIVIRDIRRYLGADPILELKDSTGTKTYYYNEYFYNDSLFAISMKNIGKAVEMNPERLDLKALRTDALCAYEKGSPDMALAGLKATVDSYYSKKDVWTYQGDTVDDSFFKDLIQQYCALFYSTGTAESYAAFKAMSEKMLSYRKDDPTFLANIGSYMLVAENNPKAAVKWYNKVLKVSPGDYAAIKNCIIAARKMKNIKLEKKYLPLLVEYGPESEKNAAEARLQALESM